MIAWALAVTVLAIATGFQGGLHSQDIPLLLLNGLLVAATGVGAKHVAVGSGTGKE